MFVAMADHFVNQLKILKDLYLSEYTHIDEVSLQGIKKNSFGAVVDRYLYGLTCGDMSFFETDRGKAMRKLIEKAVTIEEIESENTHGYRVIIDKKHIDPTKNELNIKKAAIEHEKYYQMLSLHNNNTLISILIRFEGFLFEYFKWLITRFPDKYLNEKCVKYAELLKYDFNDMRQELVHETVNDIMSQSLQEWFKIFRSHKFDIESLKSYIESYTEIHYRRNLIVHNDCKVNRTYLAGVGNASNIKLGVKLKTNKMYIIKAYNVTTTLIYGILYASLKGNKEDLKEYLDFLFATGFNHMINAEWEVSSYIFQTLIMDQNQNIRDKELSRINYWISCKNNGHFEEVKEEIEATDYSAMSPSIRMAKEMLLEKYELAIPLLEDSISIEFPADVVETWPIFIQFRETPYYNAFKEKHQKQLEQQEIRKSDLECTTEHNDESDLKNDFTESDYVSIQ